jgi:hypothetical protein
LPDVVIDAELRLGQLFAESLCLVAELDHHFGFGIDELAL